MKTFGMAVVVVLMILAMASPAAAQAPGAAPAATNYTIYGAAIGAGLVILGAGFGFGKIGASALEGMARQPEAAGRIQPAMIIIAALLEGATFFALLICMLNNR